MLLQSVADVEVVRRLAPANFWPRPAVDSAIVLIKPILQKAKRVPDMAAWRRSCALYTHRRKNLRQALSGWPQGRRDKKEVDAKLAAIGFDGSAGGDADGRRTPRVVGRVRRVAGRSGSRAPG